MMGGRETTIALTALADTVAKKVEECVQARMDQLAPSIHRVEFPGPRVINEVQTPEVKVEVDMTPVAEAINNVFEKMMSVMDSHAKMVQEQSKAMERMMEKIAANPPVVEVKPTINVPESVVNVKAPVKVEMPTKKRAFKITHADDDSETIVTEIDG